MLHKSVHNQHDLPQLQLFFQVEREPKVLTGYLARYRKLVTSGNRGAILEIPKND